MTLTSLLEKSVELHPDRVAVTKRMGYRTVSLTYRQLMQMAQATGQWLADQGVRQGDAVLLLASNSPYWAVVYWACLLRGFVIVPLNVQMSGDMVQRIARQTGAKILLAHRYFKEDISATLTRYDVAFLPELIGAEADKQVEAGSADIKASDVFQILYTSGTTGDPKGVLLTHDNVASNVAAISDLIPISSHDRFLSILPLSHVFEQVIGFLVPLSHGARIVYAHSPAKITQLLREYHITKMAAVPEFLQIVMGKIEMAAEEQGRRQLLDRLLVFSGRLKWQPLQRLLFRSVHKEFGGKLRVVACGGAPLNVELEKKWNALGVTLLQGYGLSETSPVLTSNTFSNHRLGSVGPAISGVDLKVAADGEILARGPNVFQGYFKDVAKTKAVFTADGWFKTGDIGEIDDDGFVYLKGRKKYMILGPGGQNVYPEDIEEQLDALPQVKASCVVGLESAGRMEIHAVLVLDDNKAGIAKIIDQANNKLASYQRIMDWTVWPDDDFPRSATRKVKKGKVIQYLKARAKQPARQAPAVTKTPLIQLLAEISGQPAKRIGNDTKLVRDLKIDSLLRIELVAQAETRFGVVLDESKITSTTSVADVQRMIDEHKPLEPHWRWRRWPLSRPVILLRFILQSWLLWPATRLFVTVRVEGADRLKKISLPVIIMPNHISYLDGLVVARALPRRLRRRLAFAAATDVLYDKYKRYTWLTELLLNTFPFPRREDENIRFGLDYMGRLLDRSYSIVVFPEGRMSRDIKLLPLKKGAGLVAVEMAVSVVPVKIIGTAHVIPCGKVLPRRRGQVVVKFGQPVTFKRSDSYLAVTAQIQKMMEIL